MEVDNNLSLREPLEIVLKLPQWSSGMIPALGLSETAGGPRFDLGLRPFLLHFLGKFPWILFVSAWSLWRYPV